MDMKANYAEQPLLDDDQIAMLTEGDRAMALELMEDLVGLFLDESQQRLDELWAFLEAGDAHKVERCVHAIAGSSANIGGKRLWAVAKYMEAAAEAGDLALGVAAADDLRAIYAETCEALKGLVEDLR